MARTSQMTRTLEIPSEPGVTVTIRKLSHGQLNEARTRKIEFVGRLATAIKDLTLPENVQGAEAARDEPANTYDIDAILTAGVVGWSYDCPVTAEAVLDQDEEWALFVFDELMKFSLRSKDEGEASGAALPPTTNSDRAALPAGQRS